MFDLDAFLDALPRHEAHPPKQKWAFAFKDPFKYPLNGPYNGFTGLERRRGGQIYTWACMMGILHKPKDCSICGGRFGGVNLHSEDYYNIFTAPALCRSCHKLIHQRFKNPRPWRMLVEGCSKTGREWFALAPLEPIDMAAVLRERHGDGAQDLINSPFYDWPEGTPFPKTPLVALDADQGEVLREHYTGPIKPAAYRKKDDRQGELPV